MSAFYQCTRLDKERDNEGRLHLVAYGHRTTGCDAAGCAGDELRLGRIDPFDCWADGETELAEVEGDVVELGFGTIAAAEELAGGPDSGADDLGADEMGGALDED